MVRLNKNLLTKQQIDSLFQQLNVLFAGNTPSELNVLLSDLLGEEEKIMLAKRLAIIIMLTRNQTAYFIAHTLHVSPATVTRIQSLLESGKYQTLAKKFQKPTPFIIDMIEAIDSILHLGGILPHYGQTHASEEYRKHKKR